MFRTTILSARALPGRLSRAPGPRFFSSSHITRSAVGYGEDPTEQANNAGTKTPASSPNPSPAGSSATGTTDPETARQNSKDKPEGAGTPANKDKAVGQGPDAEVKKVMGEDGAGKEGPPGEKKEIGSKPHKQ